MTSNKTKRALLMSCLSLLLCMSMLIGTTFAWFTDTASTGVNTIVAGNLDIELDYWNGEAYVDAADAFLFDQAALWEPGHTEVAYIRIHNAGTLDLKYELSVYPNDEVGSININGEPFVLSDYLVFKAIEGKQITSDADLYTRDSAREAAGAEMGLKSYTKANDLLESGAYEYIALVVYMPESVGNDANYRTGETAPSIELSVNVTATQAVSEYDSFGNDYDAGADFGWDGTVGVLPEPKPADPDQAVSDTNPANVIEISTPEELAAFAVAVNAGNSYVGYTVKLTDNIDLNNQPWTPIGYAVITNNKYDWDNSPHFAGVFDGQGHTISNLYIDNPDTNIQGLFGYGKLTEIKNLTIYNAQVTGLRRSAVLVGQNDATMKVSNIRISGDIKVEVKRNEAGTVVGRGGLGEISNVIVDVSEDSYVKCSVDNNNNWEYVGGVWGHAWPSKATQISSNIDVYAYATSAGGIGGGCAISSDSVVCDGDVIIAIDDTELDSGFDCSTRNGLIYGFGVGSSNAAAHTNCKATGTLTINGTVITSLEQTDNCDTAAALWEQGYSQNDVRFGAPYYAAGVIAIVD